jgi:hypothetical protein
VFPRKDTFSPEAQDLIHTIDEVHKDFHATSLKITELSVQGDMEEVRRLETELMQRSNRLIQAILKLDQQQAL